MNRPCSAAGSMSMSCLARHLQQWHHALQHQHRVQVARHPLQQLYLIGAQARVPAQEGFQAAHFWVVWRSPNSTSHTTCREGHGDQLVYIQAAVAEDAQLPCIGDGGIADDDARQVYGNRWVFPRSWLRLQVQIGNFSQYTKGLEISRINYTYRSIR